MKKRFFLFVLVLSLLTLAAGCGNEPQPEQATSPTPATEATTVATEMPTEETQTSNDYDPAYYIDTLYAAQLDRYYTALYQQWDMDQYLESDLSLLPYYYYNGNPLDNVGFSLVDLDGDGSLELVIGAIYNAHLDPSVFEIWTLAEGAPVMLAQGSSGNRYVLQYDQEQWYVANEASNSAASRATYYFALRNGALELTQGILFDAFANEQNPWFLTRDLDWDTTNDEPIDEATATAITDENRAFYTAPEYTAFAAYRPDAP